MLAGHFGAAMGLAGVEKRLNLGYVVLASVFADILLWVLVLLGVEQVIIPPDYANLHYLTFEFPFSHSLVATLIWAVLGGVLTWVLTSRWTSGRLGASLTIAGAVLLHWVLDFIVHIPDMPVAGANSGRLGLGMWNHLPAALALESLITAVGLIFYMLRVPLPRLRAWVIALVTLVLVIITDLGQSMAPLPSDMSELAASSLLINVLLVAIAFWIGYKPRFHATKTSA